LALAVENWSLLLRSTARFSNRRWRRIRVRSRWDDSGTAPRTGLLRRGDAFRLARSGMRHIHKQPFFLRTKRNALATLNVRKIIEANTIYNNWRMNDRSLD
jgi:hypothetical protein